MPDDGEVRASCVNEAQVEFDYLVDDPVGQRVLLVQQHRDEDAVRRRVRQ